MIASSRRYTRYDHNSTPPQQNVDGRTRSHFSPWPDIEAKLTLWCLQARLEFNTLLSMLTLETQMVRCRGLRLGRVRLWFVDCRLHETIMNDDY